MESLDLFSGLKRPSQLGGYFIITRSPSNMLVWGVHHIFHASTGISLLVPCLLPLWPTPPVTYEPGSYPWLDFLHWPPSGCCKPSTRTNVEPLSQKTGLSVSGLILIQSLSSHSRQNNLRQDWTILGLKTFIGFLEDHRMNFLMGFAGLLRFLLTSTPLPQPISSHLSLFSVCSSALYLLVLPALVQAVLFVWVDCLPCELLLTPENLL